MKLKSFVLDSILCGALVALPTAFDFRSSAFINAATFDASDPVEVLGKALQLPNDITGNRDKAIAEASAKIQFPADIWRAACLADWREFHSDGTPAKADIQVKNLLVTRFQSKLESILSKASSEETETILELVLTIAREERLGGNHRPFSKASASVFSKSSLMGTVDERVARIRVYGLLNPETSQGLQVFSSLLAEKEMRIRRAALDGISYWVEASGPAEDVKNLGNNARRRTQATLCINTLPLVQSALKDTEPEVRKRAANHLRIGGFVLTSMIADPMGKTVPGSNDPGLPSFIMDRKTAFDLAMVMEKIRPVMLQLIRDTDLETRLSIHRAMEELAMARKAWKSQTIAYEIKDAPAFPVTMKEMIEELAKSVSDSNFRVRRTALETFELLGPEGSAFSSNIIKALDDPDRFVRWTAVRTLGEIGSAAPADALSKLKDLLQDPDGDVRKAASIALSKLQDK